MSPDDSPDTLWCETKTTRRATVGRRPILSRPVEMWYGLITRINLRIILNCFVVSIDYTTERLLSLWPDLCSASSLHSFLISYNHRSTTPSSTPKKNIDRSFRYASPSLWNKLPASFRQPCSSSDTTSAPSITPCLFHSRLKTYLFHKSFHHRSSPTGLP